MPASLSAQRSLVVKLSCSVLLFKLEVFSWAAAHSVPHQPSENEVMQLSPCIRPHTEQAGYGGSRDVLWTHTSLIFYLWQPRGGCVVPRFTFFNPCHCTQMKHALSSSAWETAEEASSWLAVGKLCTKAYAFCTSTGLPLCNAWAERDYFGPQFFNMLQFTAGKIPGVRISAAG